VAIAALGRLRTVAVMTETTPDPLDPTTSAPILDLEDLQARYDIGRTKATELALSDEFPNTLVPGMHRYPLAALQAWELAHSLVGTVAEPKPAVAPTPVVVAAPAAARPGRKSASNQRAA